MEGNLIWEYPMEMPVTRHGMGTSPIIHNDLVILNCFGYEQDPSLLALSKENGEIVWKYTADHTEEDWNDSYSTPVVYKDEIIIYRDDNVSGYSIRTGEQLWRFLTGLGDAVCTPVFGKDILYVTIFSTYGNRTMLTQFPQFPELASQYDNDGDNLITKKEITPFEFLTYPEKEEVSARNKISDYFSMWDRSGDGYIDSLEWNGMNEFCESFFDKQGIKAIKLGGTGELSMMDCLWVCNKDIPHVTSPLLYKDYVYMVKSGGILSCFNSLDGELCYRERIGAAGAYFSSPVAVSGRIYLASRNGKVTVIEAGEELKILIQNDLDEIISATPAILDDKIYLRTAQKLYAFGE
jgi:outer membrane protein assembly factor BamB